MRISVITATRNCADTLGDCLASVASQTYPDVEHVIIDGASTDGSLDLLQQYPARSRAVVSEPDHGIYDALNKGIARATGDVIGFLHADDVYGGTGVLARIAAELIDTRVSGVFGDLEYVRRSDPTDVVRIWKATPFRKELLARGWMPPHPTLYVRREWYERIGGLDSSYRIGADYLSILQLFGRPDFSARYVPEVLVRMRLGGASNRSLKAILTKTREDWRSLQFCGLGISGGIRALAWKNFSKLGQFRIPGRPSQ